MNIKSLLRRIDDARIHAGRIEDQTALATINFMFEVMKELAQELDTQKENTRQANEIAGCLANGIIPD